MEYCTWDKGAIVLDTTGPVRQPLCLKEIIAVWAVMHVASLNGLLSCAVTPYWVCVHVPTWLNKEASEGTE